MRGRGGSITPAGVVRGSVDVSCAEGIGQGHANIAGRSLGVDIGPIALIMSFTAFVNAISCFRISSSAILCSSALESAAGRCCAATPGALVPIRAISASDENLGMAIPPRAGVKRRRLHTIYSSPPPRSQGRNPDASRADDGSSRSRP
jgi:hypothetical protein